MPSDQMTRSEDFSNDYGRMTALLCILYFSGKC